jgi:hypothetical protein
MTQIRGDHGRVVPTVNKYPVMVIGDHPAVGVEGGWNYVADEPPAQGDEIAITRTSGLAGGDSMGVRVKRVAKDSPFTIAATMLF